MEILSLVYVIFALIIKLSTKAPGNNQVMQVEAWLQFISQTQSESQVPAHYMWINQEELSISCNYAYRGGVLLQLTICLCR